MKRRLFALVLLASTVPTLASEATSSATAMPHRMMMLVLQLGIIIFAARLGSMLAERAKMPGVLGELLGGMLVGPYVLGGIVLPGFPHGLFPHGDFPVSPELYGICSLAAVVLLFMVGLETDIRLFMRYSVAGTLVGVGGVVVSFVLGDLTAMVFAKVLTGHPAGFLSPPCLFLGIISTATSVGISARILTEKRKVDTPEGVTILAGAVIDDVLGIILLGIGLGVIAASRGSGSIDWAHIGLIAVKAVGVWLAATAIGLLASHKISVLLKWFGDRSAIAIMALGLALVLAGLFEEAGLAMIVGAYVMGLSLSRADISHVIRERLDPLYAFLVPIFFAVMGMLVDLRLLASPQVLLVGVAYTVIADVAKVVGCGIPALLCGFNTRGALRIGFGMLPRGEVTLIIAGIGLATGVLTPEVFGVVVLMIFLTALVAPPALVKLFSSSAEGLKNPAPPRVDQELVFNFPSPQTAGLLREKLLSAFETEGFFVHAINHRRKIYQLRRNGTIIGLWTRGNDLVFDCPESEVGFVSVALYEVLAELEQMIREIRKPVNRKAVAERLQQTGSEAADSFDLSHYLDPETMLPELAAATKEEAIEELLHALVDSGKLGNFNAARTAVLDREAMMSTGMQFGVALPHARTDTVESIICAVGLKKDGLEFECLDGAPATIIVLALSPTQDGTPHMQFISTVSQCLDDDGREALLACDTAADMHRAFVSSGQKTSIRT